MFKYYILLKSKQIKTIFTLGLPIQHLISGKDKLIALKE